MEKKLNSNHLKLLAIIAMTVDHIADLLFPGFSAEPLPIVLHIIGRLTAPNYVVFHMRGIFLYEKFKEIHDANVCVCGNIPLRLLLCFRDKFYPFQHGGFFQSDKRYMDACMVSGGSLGRERRKNS